MKLKKIRNKKGLTQKQLAAKAGIDERTIRYLEKGEKSPTLSTLTKIAKALNLKVTNLLN